MTVWHTASSLRSISTIGASYVQGGGAHINTREENRVRMLTKDTLLKLDHSVPYLCGGPSPIHDPLVVKVEEPLPVLCEPRVLLQGDLLTTPVVVLIL